MLSRTDWELGAAKVEGIIPFIFEGFDELLALLSVRRAWRFFERDFPFAHGVFHEGSLDHGEIMRSWQSDERQLFLSVLSRHGRPAVKSAVRQIMDAKGYRERTAEKFLLVDSALSRLDDHLPTRSPIPVLEDWIEELRSESPDFLEVEHVEWDLDEANLQEARRPRADGWAAGIALALRPEVFGLGKAPFLVPGALSKRIFAQDPDMQIVDALRENLEESFDEIYAEIAAALAAYRRAENELSDLYSSSRAFETWKFAYGAGPTSIMEVARMLAKRPQKLTTQISRRSGRTKRPLPSQPVANTAKRAVEALLRRGLVSVREDKMIIAQA